MRLLRPGAERVQQAGDPVVEPRADVDHQIAAVHRHVRLVKAVHAQHPQPPVAAGRVGAKAHQRRGDRKAGRGDEVAQQA